MAIAVNYGLLVTFGVRDDKQLGTDREGYAKDFRARRALHCLQCVYIYIYMIYVRISLSLYIYIYLYVLLHQHIHTPTHMLLHQISHLVKSTKLPDSAGTSSPQARTRAPPT